MHADWIGLDNGVIGLELDRHFVTLLARPQRQRLAHRADDLVQIGRRALQVHLALNDPRDVQQIVDQPRFEPRVAHDGRQHGARARRQRGVGQQRGRPHQHRRQGRAQLVAQHGDELILGLAGLVRALDGLAQRLLLDLLVGARVHVDHGGLEDRSSQQRAAARQLHMARGNACDLETDLALVVRVQPRTPVEVGEHQGAIVGVDQLAEPPPDDLSMQRPEQGGGGPVHGADDPAPIEDQRGERGRIEEVDVLIATDLERWLALQQLLVLGAEVLDGRAQPLVLERVRIAGNGRPGPLPIPPSHRAAPEGRRDGSLERQPRASIPRPSSAPPSPWGASYADLKASAQWTRERERHFPSKRLRRRAS